MELSEVVPWGRSLREYKKMFSLTDGDLGKKILGCGDGPACFNAELSAEGGNVTSIDPIYRFNAGQILSRIKEIYPKIMEQVSKNKNDYVWKNIRNVEELGRVRMDAMNTFLKDYKKHQESERYIDASLPNLPFEGSEFDLALCSHYLFLYSEHVSLEQHIFSMKELCRVAKEVRVYPLLSIDNNKESPHLEIVMTELEKHGIDVYLVSVQYEFQRGATKMLVAKSV
ncbi:class I SAM-dependent methyltransferase [Hydrogenovibrio halophilus]|uniref:class I SAM-dependent methyltransferase n=1 Tax=Hydrogenovibrio halophilus TaxID=373391 RepID=UPI00048CE197|nr:class I SAM-dependent methyltransferase [Hydrogenovibrio halophilus]